MCSNDSNPPNTSPNSLPSTFQSPAPSLLSEHRMSITMETVVEERGSDDENQDGEFELFPGGLEPPPVREVLWFNQRVILLKHMLVSCGKTNCFTLV